MTALKGGSPRCSQKGDAHTGQPDHIHPTATSTPQSSSPIEFVAAGLVPVDLADIFAPPPEGAAASKKRTKRITGARELTANEYTAWLKEEERKKKKLAEEKERKKEEQKHKREEKEEANRRKKAAREEARKKKAVEKEEVKKRKEVEKEECCFSDGVGGEPVRPGPAWCITVLYLTTYFIIYYNCLLIVYFVFCFVNSLSVFLVFVCFGS